MDGDVQRQDSQQYGAVSHTDVIGQRQDTNAFGEKQLTDVYGAVSETDVIGLLIKVMLVIRKLLIT